MPLNLVNSGVTGPTFTKFLNNEASQIITNESFDNRIAIYYSV